MSLTYDVLKDDVRARRPIDFGFVTYVPERTCRMGAPIDGEYRCGECGHLNRETYRADKGWYPPEYCAHCGARVVKEEA